VVGGMAHERFADQRGNLALPVSGPASIQEARRAESDGPGLEFASSRGAAVRAAAAGRVAFAERYGSYGQIVIVDHGERFYTVYGGLGGVDVQVGDDVSKSARLGSAGADPVYFEVRRGTKTQEARGWLGL
jgi:septal ring factor EnvC (AmiA/AmiB activator)